jgi:hypothetical protein
MASRFTAICVDKDLKEFLKAKQTPSESYVGTLRRLLNLEPLIPMKTGPKGPRKKKEKGV